MSDERDELCFICGERTGWAGRADDSIFIDTGNDEFGPLCTDCLAGLRTFFEDESGAMRQLAAKDAEIDTLLADNAAMRKLLSDALPHIECSSVYQSSLITAVGNSLESDDLGTPLTDELARLRESNGKLVGPVEDGQFLILTTKHGYVGNSYQWWGPNHSGYVCGLSRAGRYSREEADAICAGCDWCVAVPVAVAVSMAEATVDMQKGLHRDAAKKPDPGQDLIAEIVLAVATAKEVTRE